MAIRKPITSQFDGGNLSDAHHRIVQLRWSPDEDKITVFIKTWVSLAARNAGRPEILSRVFSGTMAQVFSGTGGVLARVQNWLKTLPEFSGGIDE